MNEFEIWTDSWAPNSPPPKLHLPFCSLSSSPWIYHCDAWKYPGVGQSKPLHFDFWMSLLILKPTLQTFSPRRGWGWWWVVTHWVRFLLSGTWLIKLGLMSCKDQPLFGRFCGWSPFKINHSISQLWLYSCGWSLFSTVILSFSNASR